MSLRRSVARGLLWSAARQGGAVLVSFVAFLVFVRFLDAEDFGAFALAAAIPLALVLVVDLGASTALIQRRNLEDEHRNAAFWMAVVAGAGLTAAFALGAEIIARLLADTSLTPIIRAISPIFLLAGLATTQSALARRNLAFRAIAARGLVASIVGAAAGIVSALLNLGALSLVASQLGRALAATVTMWTISAWRPGFRITGRHLSEVMTFGWKAFGGNVVGAAYRHVDRLIIGALLGITSLGYYEIARRFVDVVVNGFNALAQPVILPAFSRLQTTLARLRAAFLEATRLTALLVFPAFLGLAAVSSLAVPVLAGPRWTPSVPVLPFVAATGLLVALSSHAQVALNAVGRPGRNLLLLLAGLSIDAAGMWVAAPYGLVIVAAVPAARALLFIPVHYALVRGPLGIDLRSYVRPFLAPFLATVPLVVGCVAIAALGRGALPAPALLVAALATGAALYATAIYLAAPGLLQEARAFVRLALQGSPRAEAGP